MEKNSALQRDTEDIATVSDITTDPVGPRHLILQRKLRSKTLLVQTLGSALAWEGSIFELATNHRFISGLSPLDAFAFGLWLGEERERKNQGGALLPPPD